MVILGLLNNINELVIVETNNWVYTFTEKTNLVEKIQKIE